MTVDVERQVRAYAEFLDSTLPVLEAEDAMVERIGTPPVWPIQERRVRQAVPGWVWAAAAAAVVILLVGVVGLILAQQSDQPADVIQPAPTTIPISVPEAPPFAPDIDRRPGPASNGTIIWRTARDRDRACTAA